MSLGNTYVCLDILILKIKCVLPNVHTDDRNMRKEGILIGSGGYLKLLGFRIDTLSVEVSDE